MNDLTSDESTLEAPDSPLRRSYAVNLARQAEHPVHGARLAALSGDVFSPAAAERYNAAHRHCKRAARRLVMAKRLRRGRR